MTKKSFSTEVDANNPVSLELSEWEIVNRDSESGKVSNSLYRQFLFSNFEQAFEFMTRASHGPIRQQNHHPRWLNNYNKVEVWLSTSEADGAITSRDLISHSHLSICG